MFKINSISPAACAIRGLNIQSLKRICIKTANECRKMYALNLNPGVKGFQKLLTPPSKLPESETYDFQ